MKASSIPDVPGCTLSVDDMQKLLQRANSMYELTLENVLLRLHDQPYGFASKGVSQYHDERRHDVNIQCAFQAFLSSRPRSLRVLEIGCSAGLRSFILNAGLTPDRRQSVQFIGLDVDPHAIQWANRFRLIHPDNLNTQFAVFDVESGIALDDCSVDVVICSHVVEHLTDPERVLTDVRRVMKPRGLLILTTPNKGGLPERIALFLDNVLLGRRLRKCHYADTQLSEAGEVVLQPEFGHGHISEKSTSQWIALCRRIGFHIDGVKGGAMMPGSPVLEKHRWLFGLILIGESLAAGLPWRDHLSHWVQLNDPAVILQSLNVGAVLEPPLQPTQWMPDHLELRK